MSAATLQGVPVLVVDDDAGSAKLVSVILASEGCEVRTVASAEKALEALATFRPRAIILDLILPGIDGLAFTRQIKADPATRDSAVIAVTVRAGVEAERAARKAGCVAYLTKPIDSLTFASIVLAHLPEGGAS